VIVPYGLPSTQTRCRTAVPSTAAGSRRENCSLPTATQLPARR